MGQAPDIWLLVSDIDDTLTGDREGLEALCGAISGNRDRLKLALNSSRPHGSVDETIASYFPDGFRADAVITGLGTEIRVDGQWLSAWSEKFADWPRSQIADIVEGMGFEPHAPIFQTPAKASFAVPGKENADHVLAELRNADLPFQSIFSGESDLDLIAPGAGKDNALRFLAAHFDIPIARTVAAGDSGNDLAMFEAAGQAIAVGNARAELIRTMPVEKTYHAKSAHARGVHEGLVEYGILPKTTFDN